MRAFLTNLGCKLNQAEMESLARQLSTDGHRLADALESADVHIINTCTVTHVAARTSRKVARRGKRRSDGIRTVLTGCFVDGSPEEAARLAGVDLVVPNRDKDNLLELLYERFPAYRPSHREALPIPYVPLEFGNSRALVKIEDGCNMSCSFCIIPHTRGRQTSRPLESVMDEVSGLVAGGFREIVLTGVQISSYRSGNVRLSDLVGRLLGETSVERLRLTSIAPWDFDPKLLDLVESGRICRHFHLSLQSGCDDTLARMRRPYDSNTFGTLVDRIRSRVPGVAITTDVIVGFPGEDQREFEEGLRFVEAIGFAKVHAFPYSPRPGTSAADLCNQVAPPIQRQRMQHMLEVAAAAEEDFQRAQLGATVPVLWERKVDDGWQGTSDNYLKVHTRSSRDHGFSITPTMIDALNDTMLEGTASPLQ
jgi:threonylcarbamoyladenosine tRNA methylthiotransferase MtaB